MNLLPSASLMIHFKDYERFHQTQGNKRLHIIGIPLVMFSLLGLVSHWVIWTPEVGSIFRIDGGILLFLMGAIFSIKVDLKLSIPYLLYSYFGYLIFRHFSIPVLVGLQVLAWIFQLWGHYVYEKKSPAFLGALSHLLVGPMWMFAWMIGYYQPVKGK